MSYLAALLQGQEYHFTLARDRIVVAQRAPGVVILKPAQGQDHRKVILSCGIHGNETAPIELIDELLTELLSGQRDLQVQVMLIFGHIEAMKKQERFIDFNLNRLFNGKWRDYSQAQESARARQLEELVHAFVDDNQISTLPPIHFDLHTAIFPSHHVRFALCPVRPGREVNREELGHLTSLGLDAVVLGATESSTFSAFTQQLLGPDSLCATVELGKVRPFGANNSDDFKQARTTLATLLAQGSFPDATWPPAIELYQVKRTLVRDHEHYEQYLKRNVKNFEQLDPRQPLEKTLRGLTFPTDNEFLIFPNDQVALGQRSGLIVSSVDPSAL